MSRCKICRTSFKRRSMTHKTCSPECAEEFVKRERLKRLEQDGRQERKALRERKEKLKTLSDYKREAQAAFNSWIRWRDRNLPCISCGVTHAKWDAGHYRSRGACPELAFDEDNVHRQCAACNTYRSGNAIEYRIRLIERIGIDRVEALERQRPPKNYTIEDLKWIKKHYAARLKEAKRIDASARLGS